ncbi:DUF6507 family protein [Streptomyces sp. AN091965]|uniref:DUF6507 family protein n=1 Tax=Streptomyces sp. AN091965 TaxID=2927803 RepID=UPI0027E4665B|nr:DUF6507 family protein [Streptomyces sp. AN091965]
MTGWDISPSGVSSVTSLVGLAMDDLAKDVKAYGRNVKSAAASAGTLGEASCGSDATGPIGAALALFAQETAQDVLFLGARAAKSVNGAHEATTFYVIGDLHMATIAQFRSLAAPVVDLPRVGGKQDGHK